jgi:hypothetical protein
MNLELVRKYIAVVDMCKGTALEDTPWKCVSFMRSKGWFNSHPNFSGESKYYEFAIAIVEDEPVFIGDILFDKNGLNKEDECKVVGIDQRQCLRIDYSGYTNVPWSAWKEHATWTKPETKRTFSLNGI